MGTVGAAMTLEPVKIQFGHSYEISQTDNWTKERIPRDEVTERWIIIHPTLTFRGLNQGFEVLGKIKQKEFDKMRLESKIKSAVVRRLPDRILWDFFRTTEIEVKPDDPELDAYEADSQIDDVVAPRLEEQARLGNEAVKQWQV